MHSNKEKEKEEKRAQLPHEIFPDILFWEIGDNTKYWGEFVSISGNGTIFFKKDNKLIKGNIKELVEGYCLDNMNESLNQRRLQEELNNQKTDYFQYIQDFKKAYKEIKGENNEKNV